MSMMTKAIVLGMALCAGAAFAETEPTDPAAIARENLMKSFGGAAKTLGEMAGGKTAYDAAAAETAKAALISGAAEIAATFAAPTMDPCDWRQLQGLPHAVSVEVTRHRLWPKPWHATAAGFGFSRKTTA